MKKLICWLFVMVMLSSGVVLAEEEPKKFDLIFSSMVEASASEWLADEENRALITVLLSLDIMADEQLDRSPDLSEASYIGKADQSIVVHLRTETEALEEEKDILIVYDPQNGDAVYVELDHASDVFVEIAMDEQCSYWYENDLLALLEVMEALQEIIDEL